MHIGPIPGAGVSPRLSVEQLLATVLVFASVLTASCARTRSYYRQQADRQANCIIDQKAVVVGSGMGEFRIGIDPRSRMFDPHNPDLEPMPPDDPAAHQLMQLVDYKKGSRSWRNLPRTPFVDNPDWHQYLPLNSQGEVVLDQRGAVEMALLQSPDYQKELEDLYLSALDVSFERFRFDAQFFGGSSIFYTADGSTHPNPRIGPGASSQLQVNPLRPGNNLRVEKLTATGGELVVGLANSLMWQFAGPDDYSSSTLLDFTMVQPLLRAGGRTRVLERLTISERALLANVRQMERFRRGFYLNVVTGRGAGPGPSRRGGVFGGSGLEGFSGVGGGGFGRVGGSTGNFNAGSGGTSGGAGAAGAAGYLGLLQTAQVLRNQHANVIALGGSVDQLKASYDAGRIDRFQVDLAQQALFNAQSQLLTAETSYQNRLDNFKIDLGLPPELEVKIEDSLLDHLNLLAPQLQQLQQQLAGTLNTLRQLRDQPPSQPDEKTLPGNGLLDNGLQLSDDPLSTLPSPDSPKLATTVEPHPDGEVSKWLEKSSRLRLEIEQSLIAVQIDFDRLDANLPQRRDAMKRLTNRQEVQTSHIDPQLFDAEKLEQRALDLHGQFVTLQQQFQHEWTQLDQLLAAPPTDQDELLPPLIDTLTKISGLLLELSLTQAGARLEAITFEPVTLDPQQALAIASTYRRDWMNARTALVDSWRLIYFNANDLLSNLDIVFSGDLGNVGDNPFRFRDTQGRLRVGLEFDAPLTRLAERNIYRQSLIEYQQARRQYYQFRDQVYQGLRNTLRQVRLNEVNFELRRAAVQVAISQVDLTQLRLSEPPQAGATSQLGATTARDLVQSLSDLLNVQNDFLSVWVNFDMQRLNLEFDLGIMELAADGQRLENGMPLEFYLADLPCNSCDLGAIDESFELIPLSPINQEVIQPESLQPRRLPSKEEEVWEEPDSQS
ncbi:MAG: TolC family protein [Pirellulales bacterium]